MSTRPSALTSDDVDKLGRLMDQLERLSSSRGARITVTEPGLAKAREWALLAVGGIAIGVAGWGVQSINSLNETMKVVLAENKYRDDRVNGLEKRLENHIDSVVRLPPKEATK